MKKNVLALFDRCYRDMDTDFHARALTAVYLFDFLDRLRLRNFPADWYTLLEKEMDQLGNFLHFLDASFDFSQNSFSAFTGTEGNDVESKTGEVYFQLWKHFTKEEYFRQTAVNLKERFEKNAIAVNNVEHALDAGCGGGRYTLSLKSAGCKKVTGIDISPNSVKFAQSMNPFTDQEATFVQGSVLELPFKDQSFDFVFSNGVLHHTLSTEKGLQELFRVLKKGGRCWLYLYGGKDSLFWDIVDFCRKLLADVPQAYTQELMRVLGYPPGRIFHRSDFFYVPLNRRYLAAEVEEMLKAVGFKEFRRLTRGAAFDWEEMIHNNPHIDPYIYGDGEIRYLISK